ncbi:MAG: hypothetical protein ACRDQB_00495, partial [Thermocrispum sp.]
DCPPEQPPTEDCPAEQPPTAECPPSEPPTEDCPPEQPPTEESPHPDQPPVGGHPPTNGHRPPLPDCLEDLRRMLQEVLAHIDPALAARIAEALADHGVGAQARTTDGQTVDLGPGGPPSGRPNGSRDSEHDTGNDHDHLLAALVMMIAAMGMQLVMMALRNGVDVGDAWQAAGRSGSDPRRVLAERTARAQVVPVNGVIGTPRRIASFSLTRPDPADPTGLRRVSVDIGTLRELVSRAGMRDITRDPDPELWVGKIRDAFAEGRR